MIIGSDEDDGDEVLEVRCLYSLAVNKPRSHCRSRPKLYYEYDVGRSFAVLPLRTHIHAVDLESLVGVSYCIACTPHVFDLSYFVFTLMLTNDGPPLIMPNAALPAFFAISLFDVVCEPVSL